MASFESFVATFVFASFSAEEICFFESDPFPVLGVARLASSASFSSTLKESIWSVVLDDSPTLLSFSSALSWVDDLYSEYSLSTFADGDTVSSSGGESKSFLASKVDATFCGSSCSLETSFQFLTPPAVETSSSCF